MTTPVLIRKDNDGVFALFPTIPSDNNPDNCTVYVEQGGHTGGLCQSLYSRSKPADTDEVKQMLSSLRGYDYPSLQVVNSLSPAYRKARLAELAKVNGKSLTSAGLPSVAPAMKYLKAKRAQKGQR